MFLQADSIKYFLRINHLKIIFGGISQMFHRILVAIDQTKIGQQVFQEALSLATANNAELLLLNVISPIDDNEVNASSPQRDKSYGSFHSASVEYHVKQWEGFKKHGIEFLKLLTNQALVQNINTEFVQEIGDPSRLICEMAHTWKADLIIIGRRGLIGLSELLLGSVSNYVLHHASCSVLTVQGKTPVD
jgi:nucleotide-binding universal stress UspA family protein